MADQPGEHVMGVLPDRLGHDERGFGVQAGEHRDALVLGGDEAVLFLRLVGMRAGQPETQPADGGAERALERALRGPADLVGGGPQVAARDEEDGFGGLAFRHGGVP